MDWSTFLDKTEYIDRRVFKAPYLNHIWNIQRIMVQFSIIWLLKLLVLVAGVISVIFKGIVTWKPNHDWG